MNLRPYQLEGVEWLRSRKTALLADEMRLGKSAQAICAIHSLWPSYQEDMRIGIVCPASAVTVWHGQFAKWWNSPLPELHITSYEKATRGELDGMEFDALILDEAHKLKTADAQRTKKIYGPKCDSIGGLILKAKCVYALTGTPMPNNPSELWPTLRALAPELILKGDKPMSYWQFVMRYCKTKDNGFGLQIVGGKNLDELRERISSFVLRRRFKDVVQDAKEPVFDTLPVAGRAPDESELKKLLKNCTTDEDILAAIKRASTHVASTRRLTGLAKVKGVIDWLRDWHEGEGGKVVFMAYHRDVIHELATGLGSVLGQKVPVLMGGMAAHVKAAATRDFERGAPVFVGQIEAAGMAIDLSTADTLMFVEMDWVPGNNDQAAKRIQSVEKKSLLTILAATLPGSLDEKIQQANLRKVRDSLQIFG